MKKQPPAHGSDHLAEAANVSKRTLSRWFAHGILGPLPRRGPGVDYGEEQILRARAASTLRRETTDLDDIRRRLERATRAELESWASGIINVSELPRPVTAPSPSPTPAPPSYPDLDEDPLPTSEPGPRPSYLPPPSIDGSSGASPGANPGASPYPATRHEHVELAPGLTLLVRADCDPAVRRMAYEIYKGYGPPRR